MALLISVGCPLAKALDENCTRTNGTDCILAQAQTGTSTGTNALRSCLVPWRRLAHCSSHASDGILPCALLWA
ncbi:hypothetical protein J3E69DRAFT_335190 [Trichoderma sp. SZMC 28015]